MCEKTVVCKSVRSLVEYVIVKEPETEENSNNHTFRMRWTGIFVTCRSYKQGHIVDGKKGSLTSNSRKCDKVWAEERRMKHKENILNEGLSRAKTMAKVNLELTKKEHEKEEDATCGWCHVFKPSGEFCNSRYYSGNWVLERMPA